MKPREKPQRKKRDCEKCLGISKLHGWLEVDESARKKKKRKEGENQESDDMELKKRVYFKKEVVSERIFSLKTRAYVIYTRESLLVLARVMKTAGP